MRCNLGTLISAYPHETTWKKRILHAVYPEIHMRRKKICGLCSLCFMWSGIFGQQTLFVAPDTKSHRLLMCVLCPTRTNSWWVFFCQNCTNCWCMVFCPTHKNCWCVLFSQMLNAIFGPLLTLFNMQTPFYMIRIWYLDLKTIYFVVYGELENISANADIRNS